MTEDNTGRNIVVAGPYWTWALPMLLLVLVAVILYNDSNIDVFFTINAFSKLTGDRIWALLTFLADGLVAFVLLFPLIQKNPRIVWAIFTAVLLNTLIGQSLKHLTHVPRPPKIIDPGQIHMIGPAWTSNAFPSGHASMIFILAGAFILTARRWWIRIILLAAASLIAMSRIVVGVHWPLDVLAGAFIGWLVIWLSLKLSFWTRWGWTSWRPKLFGALLLAACLVLFFMRYTGYDHILLEQRIIAGFFSILGFFEYLKLYGIELLHRRPGSLS